MLELDKIYLGDCLNLMAEIPDRSIDMILCDLPYGMTSNKWDSIIPLDRLWKEYNRVCKRSAAIVLTASQPFTSKLIMSNANMFRHEWIWVKNRGSNFANTIREPFKEHEEVLMFSNGKWTYNKQMQKRNEGGAKRVKYPIARKSKSENYRSFDERTTFNNSELRVPSSVQKFNTEVGLHPTQKPVSLFEYLIKTYSNEDETVLDNCIGSGTTALAAIRTHRHFIGIEKDKNYYEIACNRVRKELSNPSLF